MFLPLNPQRLFSRNLLERKPDAPPEDDDEWNFAAWTAEVKSCVEDPLRLSALRETGLLDSPQEAAFDRLTRLAAQLANVSSSGIVLIDENRQFLKSAIGFGEKAMRERGTPLSYSFCQHVITLRRPLVIADARKDRMVQNNPAVAEGAIAYIGVPLILPEGHVIGSLCVIDSKPRDWDQTQVVSLQELAEMTMTEVALRKKEADFQLLAQVIPQIVWITRPDGQTFYFNQRWLDYTGIDLAKSLEHGWEQAFHPEDRQIAMDAWKKAATTSNSYSIECRLRRADGRFRWWLLRSVSHRDASGNVLKWFGTCTDIHELKLAQFEIFRNNHALQQQQTDLRMLFDFIPAIICFKDTKNGILLVNKRLAEILGKRVEDIEGRSSEEIFPEEAAKFQADDLAVIQTRTPKYGIIESFLDRHGKRLWIQTDKVPVCDPTGNVIGIVVMALDITKRKKAEEGLYESEERFAGAFEHAPIGMNLSWPDGRYLKVNRAFCELVGYSEEELLTRSFTDITHPQDIENSQGNAHRTISGEIRSYQMEKRYLHADGRAISVLLNVSLVRDFQGKPLYFIAQIQDITERKKSEARLMDLNRQLVDISRQAGMAEVATSVLHNVGNVLNSANISLEVAKAKVCGLSTAGLDRVADLMHEHVHDLPGFLAQHPPGQLGMYLGELAKHFSQEQSAILNEFKALRTHIGHISEIVARQQSHATASSVISLLPIHEVIDDALSMNTSLLEGRDFQITRELDETIPLLPLDRHKTIQILVNLIRNAQYALAETEAEEPRLTLRTSLDDQGVLKITVADNGVGIAQDKLTRIFEYGYTTRKSGHGFGLHSCAVHAQEMGGSLTVLSDGPGLGATFTLEIPTKGKIV